jgi:DNA-directed RNA polymerase subunit N (RpoN/RPB10)
MNSDYFIYYPIRCQCNKVLGDKQKFIEDKKRQGIPMAEIFRMLNINRECCRLRVLEPAIQLRNLDFTYNVDPEILKFFKTQKI